MDKMSIDKEISILGVEALMFWELSKVEEALGSLCHNWFFNNCKAYKKVALDLRSAEKEMDKTGKEINVDSIEIVPIPVKPSEVETKTMELGLLKNLLNFGSSEPKFLKQRQKY